MFSIFTFLCHIKWSRSVEFTTGIQAIISFAMGATMVTSIYILIVFVVLELGW